MNDGILLLLIFVVGLLAAGDAPESKKGLDQCQSRQKEQLRLAMAFLMTCLIY
jgi:hypothetical protein